MTFICKFAFLLFQHSGGRDSESVVQGHPELYIEFEVSLGYKTISQEIKKKNWFPYDDVTSLSQPPLNIAVIETIVRENRETVCMYVYHVCVQHLGGQEGVIFPGTGITDS